MPEYITKNEPVDKKPYIVYTDDKRIVYAGDPDADIPGDGGGGDLPLLGPLVPVVASVNENQTPVSFGLSSNKINFLNLISIEDTCGSLDGYLFAEIPTINNLNIECSIYADGESTPVSTETGSVTLAVPVNGQASNRNFAFAKIRYEGNEYYNHTFVMTVTTG